MEQAVDGYAPDATSPAEWEFRWSSRAVAPHLTADAPARVPNAGAGVSRLRPRHRDTSPGGSYGTPGVGAAAKGARMQAECPQGFRLRETVGSASEKEMTTCSTVSRLRFMRSRTCRTMSRVAALTATHCWAGV